jgi:hypothetical protein
MKRTIIFLAALIVLPWTVRADSTTVQLRQLPRVFFQDVGLDGDTIKKEK